ncbi:HIT family protein [Litoricola sp.]|jgi:diadenosine tetraphosphate (Ap4A) HIT family hydrolase|nr:HIT family protein [Litorivicinus sp.]
MDAVSFVIDSQLKQTSYPLTSLDVCDLRLVDDQRWPWLLIIPRVAQAVELIDISPDLRAQVWLEIDHVGRVMRDQFSPHKLNIAALGNQVRQLHVHCIARFPEDEAWPNPVWGVGDSVPYDSELLNSRLNALRAAFS